MSAIDAIRRDVAAVLSSDHAVDAVWTPASGPDADVRGVFWHLPEVLDATATHVSAEYAFQSAEIGAIEIGDLLLIEQVSYRVALVEPEDYYGMTTVQLHG